MHPVDGISARRNLCFKQEAPPPPECGMRHLGMGIDPLAGDLISLRIRQAQLILAEPLCFHVKQAVKRFAVRVDQKQGIAFSARIQAVCDILHGQRDHLPGPRGRRAHLTVAVVTGLPDAGAAHRVVKLIEEQAFPKALHLIRLRSKAPAQKRCKGKAGIRRDKTLFRKPDLLLEFQIVGIAARVDLFKGSRFDLQSLRIKAVKEIPEG